MLEVFNHTVRGASHTRHDIPCQDHSYSYDDSSGRFQIATIADGHGDQTCVRSKQGSRFAVDSANEALKELAHVALKGGGFEGAGFGDLVNATTGGFTMRNLCKRIVSLWHERVKENLAKEPLSECEMDDAGDAVGKEYRQRIGLNRAYGTTLIACLICDDKALFVHQGDGRCVVFHKNGAVNQPVPWDDRCFDVFTTSMCDGDAAVKMRTWVIDLLVDPLVAVFMGSDGIEDSFVDMEGTRCFYRRLAGTLVDLGIGERLDKFLKDYLPKLSESGSADDISVAGIVDREGIKPLLPSFDQMIHAYKLDDEISKITTRRLSMERKHRILAEKVKDLENSVKRGKSKKKRITEDIERRESENDRDQRRLKELDKQKEELDAAKSEYEEYHAEYRRLESRLEGLRSKAEAERKAAMGGEQPVGDDTEHPNDSAKLMRTNDSDTTTSDGVAREADGTPERSAANSSDDPRHNRYGACEGGPDEAGMERDQEPKKGDASACSESKDTAREGEERDGDGDPAVPEEVAASCKPDRKSHDSDPSKTEIDVMDESPADGGGAVTDPGDEPVGGNGSEYSSQQAETLVTWRKGPLAGVSAEGMVTPGTKIPKLGKNTGSHE